MQSFEAGMKKYPKDWRQIEKHKIASKSILGPLFQAPCEPISLINVYFTEIVEFYFYWHTSQRYKDWKMMYFPAPKVSLYSNFALGPLVSPEELRCASP